MTDEENMPSVVYSGKLPIADIELDCAVLDNGTRILTAASIFKAFGRPRKGQNNRLEIGGISLPPFIAAKNLKPYIDDSVLLAVEPVSYKDGSQTKSGYAASILPKMCEVYLFARRAGALTGSQDGLAIQSEIILSALAQVGIDALVDEATGYQLDRSHDALRLLISKYINSGLQKWVKTFPDAFFAQLDKLYGNKKTISRKRPQYYGKFINKYIYDPIEHGYLKSKLNRLNINEDGTRKARFHQWLSDDGRSILANQIGRIQMLMELSPDIEKFKKHSKRLEAVSIAPFLYNDMNDIIPL